MGDYYKCLVENWLVSTHWSWGHLDAILNILALTGELWHVICEDFEEIDSIVMTLHCIYNIYYVPF